MKKFLIIFGLVLGFASAVYADGHFCCGGGKTKEQCCAEKEKCIARMITPAEQDV